MHNGGGGENETEQLVQKSTSASPLAGRKEWAALRSCYSVVCHESQSADVCSVSRPNLHTPTINLLPGNPRLLTRLCVCASVCYVYMCVAFSSSLSGRESVGECIGKRVWAKIKSTCVRVRVRCRGLNVEACMGLFK